MYTLNNQKWIISVRLLMQQIINSYPLQKKKIEVLTLMLLAYTHIVHFAECTFLTIHTNTLCPPHINCGIQVVSIARLLSHHETWRHVGHLYNTTEHSGHSYIM